MEEESEFCTEILSHDQRGEKWVQCEKCYACVLEEDCVCSVRSRNVKLLSDKVGKIVVYH